jgi:hypothetical protein
MDTAIIATPVHEPSAMIPLSFFGESVALTSPNMLVSELKKGLTEKMSPAQRRNFGRAPHPILMQNACQLMISVAIQQTCIQTKRDAIVGLGFETEEDAQQKEKKRELDEHAQNTALGRPSPKPQEKPTKKADEVEQTDSEEQDRSKVEKLLDPLTDSGFLALLKQCGEDFENTGNAYIEVVREGSTINALWHMPAAQVHVFVEAKKPHYHFEVDGTQTLKYAAFGDLDRFEKDNPLVKQDQITELIQIKQPTSLDPYYGLPSWLAPVPWLELAQMMLQCHFDFFQNRAVPSLVMFLTGGKMTDDDFKKLQEQVKQTIGAGKNYRSFLANLPHSDMKVQVERLAAENKDSFAELWSTVQLMILSSHRIPPLLAGVTLPGKMAAANELPNALIAFQTLYIGPNQKQFELKLGLTLGSKEAGLGLTPKDFRFKKITDQYDMGQVDTMSRMRETATDAQMQGRKLEEGLKE